MKTFCLIFGYLSLFAAAVTMYAKIDLPPIFGAMLFAVLGVQSFIDALLENGRNDKKD